MAPVPVLTPQERSLTLLAQPPNQRTGRSVDSRLLVGGCLAVWSVAILAGQSKPTAPPLRSRRHHGQLRRPRRRMTNATAACGHGDLCPISWAGSCHLSQAGGSVLRHVPQRKLKTGGLRARSARSRAPSAITPRSARSRAQAARRPDAADQLASAGCRHDGVADPLDGERARSQRGDASAGAGPAPPQSHRVPNAIRDLLALEVDATKFLPADDSTRGFDNIAGALTMSPALMEAYLSAAGKISRLAIGNVERRAQGVFDVPADTAQNHHIEGLPFGTRGGMLIQHQFPADGEYTFNVKGVTGYFQAVLGRSRASSSKSRSTASACSCSTGTRRSRTRRATASWTPRIRSRRACTPSA